MEGYEKLGYVALNVSDVTKSRDFYEKQVGLQRSGDLEDGTAFLRCSEDHHTIALYRGDRPGLKRAGFEMKSERALDQLASRLASEGIAVHEVPGAERKDLGLGRAFRISEPSTGATYEFYASMRQWGGQPFKPTVAKIQRLGHFVLKVADFDAACRFHTEVLGFRVSDMIDGTICFMRCHPNPYHHGVGLGRASDVLLHHVNFMVTEVDDIGRGISRFNKAQVPIVNGPGRHPPSGSMFLYYLDSRRHHRRVQLRHGGIPGRRCAQAARHGANQGVNRLLGQLPRSAQSDGGCYRAPCGVATEPDRGGIVGERVVIGQIGGRSCLASSSLPVCR